MDLHGVIGTVHAFVEKGDPLPSYVSQRDCDLAVMHRCGSENANHWHTGTYV